MKKDMIYLKHISDAMDKISLYVSVGYEQFMSHSHWQDATIRQLEIIGEATKHLSQETRNKHPDVPWRRIAGLRDVLHDYMGVDLEAVWEVTQRNLPELEEKIREILGELEKMDT